MKARLTENPKDWRDFTGSICLMAVLITGMMRWKGRVPTETVGWVAAVGATVYLTAWWRPRWFRCFYRTVKPVMHGIGQVMGLVILTAFYLVVLTPVGLLLRLTGKRLFDLGWGRQETTYWKKRSGSGSSHRMF